MIDQPPVSVNPSQSVSRPRSRGFRLEVSESRNLFVSCATRDQFPGDLSYRQDADTGAVLGASARSYAAQWRAVSILLVVASLLALSGCGAGGFAQESPGANAFLNDVQKACGKLSVGSRQISWLLGADTDDTTFVDATTKLYSGQFSRSDYINYINSFYSSDTNKPALDCIFRQL